jgi:curved DNA-binding protein CbpA
LKRLVEQSFYEILEIPREATPEDVERAYERARALYGPGSLVTYTLLSAGDAELLAQRIEEARSVLLDPQARASYDSRLGPANGEASRSSTRLAAAPAAEVAAQAPESAAPVAAPAGPPAPGPAAGVESAAPVAPPEGSAWTGPLLRQAREGRGLSVLQVSERTKVTRHHIENIEAERFEKLPATVYLRGILVCLARELRLDGQKVARSYLEWMASHRAPAKHR